jgi:hypothetical protein
MGNICFGLYADTSFRGLDKAKQLFLGSALSHGATARRWLRAIILPSSSRFGRGTPRRMRSLVFMVWFG